MLMEKMPNELPEMKKQDEVTSTKFEEKQSEKASGRAQAVWIIILAFALLACFGIIVWLLLSGRPDLRITGENLDKISSKEEKDNSKKSDFDEGTIVNDSEIDLTNYDSNITITASGEHTLSGILNYTVFVNSDGPVTLNLNGVTISSTDSSAIANRSKNPLTIVLMENTTNAITDGGETDYDAALFSMGALTIKSTGDEKSYGTLTVSGRQSGGEGIATKNADLTIESGKLMVTGNDDGLNAGGDNGGTIAINGGLLWVRVGGDGIDSNKNIIIGGGNLLIMNTSNDNAALDADDGIVINGGNLVALGQGMLENPLATSPQKSLSLELSETVATGSTVYVKNTDTNTIVNFKAETSFKTLVFSIPSLTSGTYEISVDGRTVGTGVIK